MLAKSLQEVPILQNRGPSVSYESQQRGHPWFSHSRILVAKTFKEDKIR